MVKYLISETQEMDGHAYGAAHYVQIDGEEYSRAEKLNVINAIAAANSAKFVEETHIQKEDDTVFYGELVFELEEESYSYGSPVSYSFFKLPSRMGKNKIYSTETATG